MTERLSEVEQRIAGVRQLDAVITAMRGIAASRSQEARRKLPGIRAYAQMVGRAIGQALALLPGGDASVETGRPSGKLVLIALCSEQGFVGALNARILDAVEASLRRTAGSTAELLIIGDRGLMAARERGLEVAWSAPMAAHAGDASALANRLADAVFERLTAGATAVTVIHAAPSPAGNVELVKRALVPFDFARFAVARQLVPPLTTQEPAVLIPQLADEYVFAELCEAVMLSYAAENDARMRTMIAARDNIEKKLGELNLAYQRLRQEEITSEIIELAAGAAVELDDLR